VRQEGEQPQLTLLGQGQGQGQKLLRRKVPSYPALGLQRTEAVQQLQRKQEKQQERGEAAEACPPLRAGAAAGATTRERLLQAAGESQLRQCERRH
jgi:hypothetical protein